MFELKAEVDRVARSDAKVLITGESGTGKELVAHAVHTGSGRVERPFIAVNCAGLSETLLETELFGHVKGSFTGAYRDKLGKLELADTGTMFLDEIGEMTLRMQGLLLRFLETGELQKVGADRMTGRVNVRVLAATNRNLRDMITQGTFREDLFYRLNVIHLAVPPLRDHREDIPELINHFLGHFVGSAGNVACDVSPEAMSLLTAYHWPGNVRELENVIERALILCDSGSIEPEHLPLGVRLEPSFHADEDDGRLVTLEEVERRYVKRVLEECQGHRHKAANILGISERNLYRKLKELELPQGS
jgi:transcriptional regulator with PAS, ATPase and Fis domain